jgi:hypothetical protein
MSIEKIKLETAKKYGHKPTINYYYYSLNIVAYVGEEQVRKSFDSVKKYGKNVIVCDYSSIDNIKEIVEEYGFTFLTVEKTPEIFFHETKLGNKVIKEAKNNWLCYMNFWITYPDNLEDIILNWIKNNNGRKYCLKMTGYGTSPNGKIGKTHGITHSQAHVIYRPFLLEARGFDERTSYHAGARNYAIGLLTRVYRLKIVELFVEFVHALHQNTNWSKVPLKQQKYGLKMAEERIQKLSRNFSQEVKNVKNSYW